MSLYCRLIGVKPEHKDRYIELHKNPRAEVRDVMQKCGIKKHAIFEQGETLVSVFEYQGDNFALDMKRISDNPVTQEWWEIISPMQEPFPNRKDGEWWTMFNPITAFGWDITREEDI